MQKHSCENVNTKLSATGATFKHPLMCDILILENKIGKLSFSHHSRLRPDLPGDHVPPAGAVGAGGALVRLLACVGALVGGEVVRPAEHLHTEVRPCIP